MDPYVTTILKGGALMAVAVGAVVFFLYCSVAMTKLNHARTLNMIPRQLS